MAGILSSRWSAVAGAGAMCAVCLALGTWQIERRAEKNAWITEMSARRTRPPGSSAARAPREASTSWSRC
jgi:cytochrome oxidase assembly protein ShyY1